MTIPKRAPSTSTSTSTSTTPSKTTTTSTSIQSEWNELLKAKEKIKEDEIKQKIVEEQNRITFTIQSTPMTVQRGRLLGKGTFGEVFEAMIVAGPRQGELVAVKQVSLQGSTTEIQKLRSDLEREFDTMASLRHINIVQLMGFSTDGHRLYLVMELVAGRSLDDILRDMGPFRENVCRAYMKQLLTALTYCHEEKHVWHRDIKSRNILLTNSGTVKVADFGSAKIVKDMETHDVTSSYAYTPSFIAPEVLTHHRYTSGVDIWAVGCCLVEWSSGRDPWYHRYFENTMALMYHIGRKKDHPRGPAHLTDEALDFLNQCFQMDPHKRPSASQLLQHPFITSTYNPKHSRAHLYKNKQQIIEDMWKEDQQRKVKPQLKIHDDKVKKHGGNGIQMNIHDEIQELAYAMRGDTEQHDNYNEIQDKDTKQSDTSVFSDSNTAEQDLMAALDADDDDIDVSHRSYTHSDGIQRQSVDDTCDRLTIMPGMETPKDGSQLLEVAEEEILFSYPCSTSAASTSTSTPSYPISSPTTSISYPISSPTTSLIAPITPTSATPPTPPTPTTPVATATPTPTTPPTIANQRISINRHAGAIHIGVRDPSPSPPPHIPRAPSNVSVSAPSTPRATISHPRMPPRSPPPLPGSSRRSNSSSSHSPSISIPRICTPHSKSHSDLISPTTVLSIASTNSSISSNELNERIHRRSVSTRDETYGNSCGSGSGSGNSNSNSIGSGNGNGNSNGSGTGNGNGNGNDNGNSSGSASGSYNGSGIQYPTPRSHIRIRSYSQSVDTPRRLLQQLTGFKPLAQQDILAQQDMATLSKFDVGKEKDEDVYEDDNYTPRERATTYLGGLSRDAFVAAEADRKRRWQHLLSSGLA